ncbi:MAG TPA: hypothetical protein VI248_30250 [Kineosporiaceae bacterium]
MQVGCDQDEGKDWTAAIDSRWSVRTITDPTRFDYGDVDKHSLLLAPAERADVLVDFSTFAGKTLVLYDDAPAAFPARVPSYDHCTAGSTAGFNNVDPQGNPTTAISNQLVNLGWEYVYHCQSFSVAASVAAPAVPAGVTGTAARAGRGERITIRWQDVPNETTYRAEWSPTGATAIGTATLAANTTSATTGTLAQQVWYVRVGATNVLGTTYSGWVMVPSV